MDFSKIEKKKGKITRKDGRGLSIYVSDKMMTDFTNACRIIDSDKSKVLRALITDFIKEVNNQ